jgi:opacity protein-like surface antigen
VSASTCSTSICRRTDGPTPVFSKAELDFTAFVGTFTGFYRFVQEETGTADVLAGARVWATDTELTLKPGLGPGLSSDDQDVGLRAYGDVGGFGLASDITYQVLGSVNYTFTESISADAGYRYLKVDYEDGSYLFDVAFHGPFLGVVFEF